MRTFDTDEACRTHMQRVRWPHGPVCTKCGTINEAAPVGGRPGVFHCDGCKSQFTVTVGTAMECTHLPLNNLAPRHASDAEHGEADQRHEPVVPDANSVSDVLHLLYHLRAMLADGVKFPLAGIIEADETYVGGKARNRQKHRPKATRGRGTDKPMVFAAIERGGEARTAVAASANAIALDPPMHRWFDQDSILCTDGLATYRWFGGKMRRHHGVTHSAREYAR